MARKQEIFAKDTGFWRFKRAFQKTGGSRRAENKPSAFDGSQTRGGIDEEEVVVLMRRHSEEEIANLLRRDFLSERMPDGTLGPKEQTVESQ